MNTIIGIIGAKGAGKTTAFEAMHTVTNCTEITLANKLKDVCAEVFEIPRENFDSHALKERLIDPPAFMDYEQAVACYNAFDIKYKSGDNGRITDHAQFHVGKIFHTPREIAQYVGTEVLRTLEPDVHCDHAIKGLNGRFGVVTDIRFPNEVDYFLTYPNFVLVHIKNTGAEIMAGKDMHESESYLKELAKRAHVIIENEGPLKDFQEKVCGFMDRVVSQNVLSDS